MNREILLAELDRVLDVGEPLVNVFPRENQDGWCVQLPDNISFEMRLYAHDVAFRMWGGKGREGFWQHRPTAFLAELEKELKVGLLGWRAIGVLK